ncbi:ferritin [Caldalkalibacillus salinus]|uniref:ferritin n=1 Tax=Caldalkalibacillus salinus TaxID=2803787 RepID=UPI0019245EE6|nr:ferritin [Caldalkalibacillus salinus]
MISDKLHEKLNDQMNYEFFSSSSYLAMAAYCSAQSLDGFAHFFIVQSEEERYHGMKIFHFLNTIGKRAKITATTEPKNDFQSVLDCFEKSLQQEKEVTRRIYELSDIALNEREHATINFLKWFINEQVEEEDHFDSIIHKLKRIDQNSHAFFMLEQEFAKRTFSPSE